MPRKSDKPEKIVTKLSHIRHRLWYVRTQRAGLFEAAI